MVERLVITLCLSKNMVENLRKISGAGVQMVDRIIDDIDSDRRIKLMRNQVLVVIGTFNEQTDAHQVNSLHNWKISWNYSYLTSGKPPKVSKVQDKAICKIIKIATLELLWEFDGAGPLGDDGW